MKGTEKQITWATEIRSNITKTFEAMIPVIPTIAPNTTVAETAAKEIQNRIDRLTSEEVHASDIISLFKGIRFNGNLQHDFNEVMAVYTVAIPDTTTARVLLGR